jgi:hypothetical protein
MGEVGSDEEPAVVADQVVELMVDVVEPLAQFANQPKKLLPLLVCSGGLML